MNQISSYRQTRHLVVVSILLAVLLPSVHAVPDRDARVELDRIVAIVNDDVIAYSEFQSRLRRLVATIQKQGTPLPPEGVVERQVLERVILEKIQLQLARRTGIRIQDEALNRALRRMAESNGVSVGELRKILESDGYNYTRFREDLRNEIAISQLRNQQIESRVTVTSREVQAALAAQGRDGANSQAEFHLLHILVAVPDGASPEELGEAEKKADSILRDLQSGADFRQIAIARSDGQQALEGGDLGWRKISQLPTLFVDVVTEMRPGELSELIRSPNGFHIILLEENRGLEQRVITQTQARHILIKTDTVNPDAQVKRRLEILRQRVLDGDDFSALAQTHSQDRGSAIEGGDLGWVTPGDVVPAFEAVMNKLSPGQISEPFQTRFGWHIVQVLDRREYDNTKDVRRARVRRMLHDRKAEEELQLWLRRLRDEAYVEYRLEK